MEIYTLKTNIAYNSEYIHMKLKTMINFWLFYIHIIYNKLLASLLTVK